MKVFFSKANKQTKCNHLDYVMQSDEMMWTEIQKQKPPTLVKIYMMMFTRTSSKNGAKILAHHLLHKMVHQNFGAPFCAALYEVNGAPKFWRHF